MQEGFLGTRLWGYNCGMGTKAGSSPALSHPSKKEGWPQAGLCWDMLLGRDPTFVTKNLEVPAFSATAPCFRSAV